MIVVTNEDNPGVVFARVKGVITVCSEPTPVFVNCHTDEEFVGSRLCFEDSWEARVMVEAAQRACFSQGSTSQKDVFALLSKFAGFASELDYFVHHYESPDQS